MIRKTLFLILVISTFVTWSWLQAKSLPKAMLMSAVLPGTGEIYSGNLTRGVVFTTADLVLLFGAYRFNSEVHWLQDSYKQFANARAGVPFDSSNDYYELLNNWYSSDNYNAEVELYFRNLGMVYYNNPDYYSDEIAYYSIPDEEAWQWPSVADWDKYKSIRKDKQKQIMNRKLAVGALIANRVISILDSAFLTRQYNRKHLPTFSIVPDFERNGAMLSCSLEF